MTQGFGTKREEAINLLKITIDILNEFHINHLLISGTLLGYIRHNDFIPWDDDIDLLVDESIINKLPNISIKYENLNIFRKKDYKYDSIKFCFSNGTPIPHNKNVSEWKQNCLSKSNNYCWPFIDLFVYEKGPGVHCCARQFKEEKIGGHIVNVFIPNSGQCLENFRLFSDNHISFFHNDWEIKHFFPTQKVNFLGIECNIPKNPHFFLSKNYGDNYMTEIRDMNIIHKTEQIL